MKDFKPPPTWFHHTDNWAEGKDGDPSAAPFGAVFRLQIQSMRTEVINRIEVNHEALKEQIDRALAKCIADLPRYIDDEVSKCVRTEVEKIANRRTSELLWGDEFRELVDDFVRGKLQKLIDEEP